MLKSLSMATVALVLASAPALAQSAMETTTSQTTTMAPPVAAQPVPPPVGTLSTTRETHAQDAYGNETSSKATSYRDSQGVAEDRQTTTRTVVPPPPPVSTTTTTTESTTGQQ